MHEIPPVIDFTHRPAASPRSRRIFFGILAVAAIILFFGRTAISWYMDALWFGSLGYGQVFRRTLTLEWSLFGVAFLATFAVLYGWFLLLRRICRDHMPADHTIVLNGAPVNIPLGNVLHGLAAAGSAIIAFITGFSILSQWQTFALYLFRPTNLQASIANAPDAIFGKPATFYLFTLPAWQTLTGWLLTLALLATAVSFFFILVTGGTQLARRASEGLSGAVAGPWRAFSAAFAFLLLVLASRVYLGRYERLWEDHTIFGGVTYTDAHITISGLTLVALALVLGALIALANVVLTPRLRWLVLSVLPAVVLYIGTGLVGWYVAGFIVKPNEMVRERPYILNNILATRVAFGLDKVERKEFPAEVTVESADAANNQTTLSNIRLWDWRALQDTLRQIQEIRTYYDFPDIDIDRYPIDGQMRQVMLAARELSINKLPVSSRNWINEKLIYTHGYGITMNPVNGFTAEGGPNLMLSNMPIQSIPGAPAVTRPEIYFGQLTDTDVYVKTRQKEFNYPEGQSNNLNTYEGTGGIELGGFLRRLVIAFDRGDLTKLPFSDDIGPDSRLLMRRNVRQRIATLAPVLTQDQDPYLVIGDNGHLSWILDTFTTADNFPYATHYDLNGERINYMRNSVKVVVDCYNGDTTFYAFDPQDPILAAWQGVFPTLFKPASAMPADLRRHARYPEMLLKEQSAVYGLYHMTEPEVFFNREDLWTVASEVGLGDNGEQRQQAMEPNFVLMKLPGESATEFVGIVPFTPSNRNNLIGWFAGRSDGDHYGTSVVYDFPKTRLVDGPLQIEARIDQNAQLSGQLTLWNQQGSHVQRGTLIVIPCGKALLYAEPIYLKAERSPMPELRLVVLALQDKLAYAPTFEGALRTLFGGEASTLTGEFGTTASGAPGPGAAALAASGLGSANGTATSAATATPSLDSLITTAARDLTDYQHLTAEGKLAEAGQKLEDLKRTLDQLNNHKK